MPQNPLPCGQQHISRNEPSGSGIVVTALQVIEPGLPVIHIPAVAERLEQTKRTRKGACRRHLLSPRIVGIFYHGCARSVNDLDNIALRVAEIVVFRSIEFYRNGVPCSVIAEQELQRQGDGPPDTFLRPRRDDHRSSICASALQTHERKRLRKDVNESVKSGDMRGGFDTLQFPPPENACVLGRD